MFHFGFLSRAVKTANATCEADKYLPRFFMSFGKIGR
jgi:hypothetical protein